MLKGFRFTVLGGLMLMMWTGFLCQNPKESSPSSPGTAIDTPIQPSDPPSLPKYIRLNLAKLVKHPSIMDQLEVKREGIFIYETAEDKSSNQPEWVIYPEEYDAVGEMLSKLPTDSAISILNRKGAAPWDQELDQVWGKSAVKPRRTPGLPLQGMRIALDPGHMAGDMEMAEIEGKYMKMRASKETDGISVKFWEADLALATAFLVRNRLTELGAMVYITRPQSGVGAQGYRWDEWKDRYLDSLAQAEVIAGRMTRKQLKKFMRRAKEKDLYSKFFNPMDLRKRAELVNAFQPDLTLVIHYNVDSPNWEKRDRRGFFKPTDANYLMAFVPGSFMKGELATQEDRALFLQLLLSDDIDQSAKLAESFIQQSLELTHVPVVDPVDHGLSYLEASSILLESPGVYARNLTLSRLIKGPICYGESLCQDNRAEALAFAQPDIEVEGIAVSSRLEWVAEAYIQAVLEFADAQEEGDNW
ncbi:hypothetical protein [Pontibacter sp. G13]|uniref:hypothetical protein n=1 Tax=Pontibacter sp. G13 TaxID=3074898 RepID=UPI00288C231F|nr:hypothetical protein [Pontibacter sp. G13]WNJ16295.1 hypothetical protein RJD25_15635 [Pontibacter sp. G13]